MNRAWMLVGVAALACGIAGCVTPANDRVAVGHGAGAVRLEAMTAGSGRAGRIDHDPLAGVAGGGVGDGPSLRGIFRGHWRPTVVMVPVDGTAHRPIYQQRVVWTEATARQRRESPTTESALQLTQGSGGAQALEAAAQQGWATVDWVLLPLRVIGQPPWSVRVSPDEAYERVPRSWSGPGLGIEPGGGSGGGSR